MRIEIMDKNKKELIISGAYNSVLEAVEKNKEKMRCADLVYADLARANLSEADLTRANLEGAYLIGTILCDCDLNDAKISYRGKTVTIKFVGESEK